MTTATPALSATSPAPTGDALKDLDALTFLQGQPADVRTVWLERCRLLREVDQLAETDRWAFASLLRTWRRVGWEKLPKNTPFLSEVRAVERAWFGPRGCRDVQSLAHTTIAWDSWLDALAADYGRSLVPVTLEQHDRMVADVGGFFRLFPYLGAEHWEAIAAFGALDQAMNNIRDLAEDGASGRCYFPTDTLLRFGLTRSEVMAGTTRRARAWSDVMSFWLEEHLPTLADEARAFLVATDLHPSVAALRAACLQRYARVERVLRGLEWDYRAFPEAYWAEVRRELAADALGGGAKEITT